MRYAIFSDVHANRQAWEAVLADALRQGTDTLVCLGDVVGYGPRPLEVLKAVREVTPNFVLGNHDAAACGRLDPSIFNERARMVIEWTRERLDEEAIAFLQQVPLQMDGSGVQFVHAEVMEPGEFGYVDGVGPADLNLRAMTQQLGFLGHTHLPLAYSMPRKGGPVTQLPPIDFAVERGKRYLVNVGSVGEPRTTDVRASYVIYDDAEKTVSFRKVAFDVDAYIADLEATGLDIRPYFVQVVDAGRVAGAPEPAAAPQMALAHLPKVAEVVAGHHGRLVLGSSRSSLGTGGLGAGVAQPKAISPVVLALVVALVLVVVGAVAMVAMKNPDDPVVKDSSGQARQEGNEEIDRNRAKAATPSALRVVDPGANSIGPIKGLKMRLFSKDFRNLAELRTAAQSGQADREVALEDGLVSLGHAGESEGFGLVWEGMLHVPETGEYEFALSGASGAALLIRTDVVVEVDGEREPGEIRKNKVLLRGGDDTPIRIEYFHRGGERTLDVSWTGPGLDGEFSLVGRGSGKIAKVIAKQLEPDPPVPEPPQAPVKRVTPERLSQDLLTYWSFDSRKGAESRFEKRDDGRVVENLIVEQGQPLRYLVPTRDTRKPWYSPKFDDAKWEEGTNGVGYEREPGAFNELISTRIGNPDRYPHSVYVRVPFQVEDPAAYEALVLGMKCDDGFVAYLNGIRIDDNAINAPLGNLRWNSAATSDRPDKEAVSQKYYPPLDLKRLRKGENILAIHGLNHGGEPNDTNTGSMSSGMLILPSLVALRKDSTLPPEAQPRKFREDDRAVAKGEIRGQVELADGKFREAYQFSEGGSIELEDKEKFAIGDTDFSLSLWFTRESGKGQARRLISAGAGGDRMPGWALWIQEQEDGLTFKVTNGQAKSSVTAKHGSLTNGEWHHVAVTVDRERELMLIYLDGRPPEDRPVKFLKEGFVESNSGLSIGKSSDGGKHHLGKLDDLALWNRVLEEEEIAKIHENGKSLGEMFDAEGE